MQPGHPPILQGEKFGWHGFFPLAPIDLKKTYFIVASSIENRTSWLNAFLCKTLYVMLFYLSWYQTRWDNYSHFTREAAGAHSKFNKQRGPPHTANRESPDLKVTAFSVHLTLSSSLALSSTTPKPSPSAAWHSKSVVVCPPLSRITFTVAHPSQLSKEPRGQRGPQNSERGPAWLAGELQRKPEASPARSLLCVRTYFLVFLTPSSRPCLLSMFHHGVCLWKKKNSFR